ncbi:unnamed protein product [Camellia sinensis]
MERKGLKTIAEQHIQMSDTIARSCRKRVVTCLVRLSLSWLKSTKEIGERWKTLPSNEKKRFAEMAKASAEEHAKVVPCAPKSEKGKSIKAAIIDIGFVGLLGMKCTRIDHDLCAWLVQNFDPVDSSLNVHGRQLRLSCKAVNVLLGIRCEGDNVQLAGSLEAYPNIYDEVGVVNGVIPLNKLRLYLTETDGADDKFRRKIVLYVLGAMLCPTTMTALKPSFIHVVKDVNGMRAYNWAKLTLQFLHNGVRKYKSKGHRGATGCVFLLMLLYLDCVCRSSTSTLATMRSMPRLHDWGDTQIQEMLRRIRRKQNLPTIVVEFDYNNDESDADDANMDACHVENQQKRQYDEVRMSNLEFDIRELKEMMKQVLHNQTDLMEMLRHFQGKQVVDNDKVEGNDVCIINLSSNVAELKEMLKQLLQRFSLGCNEPFTEQTNLGELKQMLHNLIEGIFSRPQPAGVDKQGVDPAVGVEVRDDGVVKPSNEVNPIECNILDVQGVDHQQQNLKGTLATDKSHFHDGHKLNIEECADNQKKGGLHSGETYKTEDKCTPDLHSVGIKNVACDVHTSPTKLGQPLGATGIVRGRGKGK